LLDLGGASNCIHHVTELDQHTVAGILDGMAVVLLDLGFNKFAQMRL
jgi:hypothetical protein